MAISKIIADSITDEAVTSAKIAQGTVVAADVADGTITNAKIDTVANTKITGVITNAQLANTTGSGAVVLTTSPSLVTPALGTPSALVGTNISGTGASFTAGSVTTNANLTGHVTSVGNAAILGSFTSAQLATALSNETGSGLAVFGTSPNLITPILGTPTSGDLINCTGYASANMPTGSVLQVVTVHKSNTFSTTTTSADTDITGMSITITPSSASNKILILTDMEMINSSGASQWNVLKFWRAGVTQIAYQASSALAMNCTWAGYIPSDEPNLFSMNYLDSPNTTAATTYKFTVQLSGGTFYVNYSASLDSGHVSNITAMEIKG